MKMKHPLGFRLASIACVLAAASGLASLASAATVVWQTPTALTSWTDIYNASADGGPDAGKSVYQLNFNNTYTYVGDQFNMASWPDFNQQASTNDSDFLIGSFIDGNTHNDFIEASPSGWDATGMTAIMDGGRWDFTTFTLSNLQIGQEYLIQFLVGDNRSWLGTMSRSQTITAGGSTSGSLTFGYNAPAFASSVIGTFTADSTSLDFTFNGANTQVNSIFVAAIPEPSSALLGGLGVLALLRRRRA